IALLSLLSFPTRRSSDLVAGGVALFAAPWQPWLLAVVPIVAVVRTALNALDGMVARDTGLARPWGEVFNELCDRFADVSLLAGRSEEHTSELQSLAYLVC